MKTAVIYVRVRATHGTQEAIGNQISSCQKYAKENGLTVVKTYIENEEFGKTSNRVSLSQMIEDSRTAQWDAVITCSVDRLSRNLKQFISYKEQLERCGKTLLLAN